MLTKFSVSLMLVIGSPAVAQNNEEWVVTSDQAKCILEHSSQYLAVGSPVVIIVAPACPNPDPYVGALKQRGNTSIGNVKTRADNSPNNTVISFTSEDFKCLSSDVIRIEGDMAYIPKRDVCDR